MRAGALVALLVVALAVSACGSSSPGSGATTGQRASATSTPSTPAATTTTSTTTTTTTATAPAPTTPSPTTSTPTAAVTPPCRAANLSLAFLGGLGATGHGELGFALRNTGDQPCTTIGYPGIQFLDKAGNALPTVPTHTTQDYFGSIPKLLLTVAPGATVSFRLGVTHGMTSSAGCTTAYGLQVIPPNDTATLRTAITNGGAYECRTVTVSPLTHGTSAFP
jgi:Protein of unknown function (DUF4232)